MAASLADRVALITGGGSGIGLGIARALSEAGAAVMITGRRRSVLDEAVASIQLAGGRAAAVDGDVTQSVDAQRMVEAAVETFGALHVLVNNAGIARGGPLEGMTDDDIEAVVDLDLKGPVDMTRAALPHLRVHHEAGGAAVVNISSSVTFQATPNFSVYSAAKAGVEALTRCWALDFAGDRIRVNAISPGVVETPIFETMMPAAVVDRALSRFADATPLGRYGQPADVARLALFLASEESGWMTGAVIPLDGGLSLSGG